MKRAIAIVFAVSSLLSPRLAHADDDDRARELPSPIDPPAPPEPPIWSYRRLSIENHFAPFGPYGLVGGALGFAVHPRISLIAGFGLEEETHVGGGARYRFAYASPRTALSVGFGFSRGGDQYPAGCVVSCSGDDRVSKPRFTVEETTGTKIFYWTHLEGGFEHSLRSGWFGRLYGGGTLRVSRGERGCVTTVAADASGQRPVPGAPATRSCNAPSAYGPYLGFAIGYAFKL